VGQAALGASQRPSAELHAARQRPARVADGKTLLGGWVGRWSTGKIEVPLCCCWNYTRPVLAAEAAATRVGRWRGGRTPGASWHMRKLDGVCGCGHEQARWRTCTLWPGAACGELP
jgi:hypothetical protein